MRAILVLAAVSAILVGAAISPAHADSCASGARIMPVPGEPGAYLIETAHGRTVARAPAAAPASASAVFTVNCYATHFDADGDTVGTPVDTLHVPLHSTIHWQLAFGTHTVTNGTDSADPNAGTLFNMLLQDSSPTFDFTFDTAGTYDYFCFFHEPVMVGRIVVSQATAVPPGPLATRARFARPPSPNPARGSVSFAIAMPRDGEAIVEVLDASGRRVATVQRGVLGAGEHPLRWDGIASDGRAAAPGVYRVRLRSGGVDDTRTFSLLR